MKDQINKKFVVETKETLSPYYRTSYVLITRGNKLYYTMIWKSFCGRETSFDLSVWPLHDFPFRMDILEPVLGSLEVIYRLRHRGERPTRLKHFPGGVCSVRIHKDSKIFKTRLNVSILKPSNLILKRSNTSQNRKKHFNWKSRVFSNTG